MAIEGPIGRLERLVAEQRAELFDREVAVRCSGASHPVRLHDREVEVPAHDLEAEQAMVGLGGARAACISVLRSWPHLGLEDLAGAIAPTRSAPSGGTTDAAAAVQSLPAEVVAWKAADLLLEAFRSSPAGVRARVAQVGLRLLTPPYLGSRQRHEVFATCARWPRFDIGDREWTRDELDVLASCLSGTADGSFRVDHLPRRAFDRGVALRCLAEQLDQGRRYDEKELRLLLRRHCARPAPIVRALVELRLLTDDNGRFSRPD